MVSARFTTFLFILILLPLTFSTAHNTLLQVNKRLVAGSGSMLDTATSSVSVEHIQHGVPTVIGESDKMTRLASGRKMMMMSRGSTTKLGKGRCINGKCNQQQEQVRGNLNVKYNKLGGHYTKKDNIHDHDGFIPLNADYYVPRPHPPKNN